MTFNSKFPQFREPVNGLTHLAAAIFALIGWVVLLWTGWEKALTTWALAIYGFSLVLQFAASAAYHLVDGSPEKILRLRVLDHTAIYLLIAGSYTPFCTLLSPTWKWGALAVVWSLALIGILVKLFIIDSPRWLTAGVYVLMGWLAVLGIGELLRVMPPGLLFWLALGGVIYTLGAVVYIFRWPDFFPGVFGHHEVWHIFVILAALAHYIGILVYVAA